MVKKLFPVITVLISFILLFASCDNDMFQPPVEQVPPAPQGKAAVTVSVAGNARTILPQVSLADVTEYKLYGGKDGATEDELVTFTAETGTTLYLEPGNWHFILEAYKGSDKILEGIKEQVIVSGETYTIEFYMLPLKSGQGVVSITITFPADAGISLITLSGDMGTDEFTPDGDTFTDDTCTYTKTVASGDYFVSFRLYSGSNDLLRRVVSEMVVVRSNLNSSKEIKLTEADLKPLVEFLVSSESEFDAALLAIKNAAAADFVIIVQDDIDLAPQNLTGIEYNGKTITLISDSTERTLQLSGTGSLFAVGSGVTLILDYNITLKGLTGNNAALVTVNRGALVMREGSVIKNNSNNNTSAPGGGVCVEIGTFTMNGGKIYDNESTTGGGVYMTGGSTTNFTMKDNAVIRNNKTGVNGKGGGVYVDGTDSTFTMTGGIIGGVTSAGNTAENGGGVYVSAGGTFNMSDDAVISGNTADDAGGGVYVDSGTFTMTGGTIGGGPTTGNTAECSASGTLGWSGGGVYVGASGKFTMDGGEISYNIASSTNNTYSNGGGVFVYEGGTFIMDDVNIHDNIVSGYGGGVFLWGNNGGGEPFTMKKGDIYNNESTASNGDGGGVHVHSSTVFKMIGGDIYSNIAKNSGGGVYVDTYGTFTMTGGTIGGTTSSRSNTAETGGGVFVNQGIFTMSNNAAISGNTAGYKGGGVCVADYSSGGTYKFQMEGGTISGNTATGNSYNAGMGGGVCVDGGLFIMTGGEISGNIAASINNTSGDSYGGGVYVENGGAFGKEDGGTIYGWDNKGTDNWVRNSTGSIIDASRGHAVYVDGTPPKYRESTAGPKVDMSTDFAGVGGGWNITSLISSLEWLELYAKSNKEYLLPLTYSTSTSVEPYTFKCPSGVTNVTITLRGGMGTPTTIILNNNTQKASLFTVNSGVTLILDNNIILQGQSDNEAALVYVGNGGTLIMRDGSKITGNTNTTTVYGSGVYLENGTLEMDGGTISGNTALRGGGVYVDGNYGKFNMKDGIISGNTAWQGGGGVFIYQQPNSPSFTKTGGTIYGYTAGDTNSNVVENAANGVQTSKGHAVAYADSNIGDLGNIWYIDDTAGPGVVLDLETEDNWIVIP
ncbi:MAG: hypothetical protein LBI04_12560 [Treponema sp.]|jgi:hypothetical protein|nr:hypothetical protein [Treponema sp.]